MLLEEVCEKPQGKAGCRVACGTGSVYLLFSDTKSKVGHIVIILYLALRRCAVVSVHIAMLEHSLYNFLNYIYISRAIS